MAAADAEAKARYEKPGKEDEKELVEAAAPADLLSREEDKDIIF